MFIGAEKGHEKNKTGQRQEELKKGTRQTGWHTQYGKPGETMKKSTKCDKMLMAGYGSTHNQ